MGEAGSRVIRGGRWAAPATGQCGATRRGCHPLRASQPRCGVSTLGFTQAASWHRRRPCGQETVHGDHACRGPHPATSPHPARCGCGRGGRGRHAGRRLAPRSGGSPSTSRLRRPISWKRPPREVPPDRPGPIASCGARTGAIWVSPPRPVPLGLTKDRRLSRAPARDRRFRVRAGNQRRPRHQFSDAVKFASRTPS